MTTNRDDGFLIVLLVVGALFVLALAAKGRRTSASVAQQPTTYFARLLVERTPRSATTAVLVRLSNALRPRAILFLCLCFAIVMYPPVRRVMGSPRTWDPLNLTFIGIGLAAVGGSLAGAVPISWPAAAAWPALCIGICNVAAGGVFLAVAYTTYSSPLGRLQHGPTFGAPKASGLALLVGRTDATILPGHAKWLAQTGGSIRIPFDRLSCGITVLGEKGTGKSRLLFAIHDAIREKFPKVPILIHDPKGEWFARYYNGESDLFFAPHFTDSATWSLWDDFRNVPELRHELITTTVHAHPEHGGTFWMDQAVDLLEQAAGFPTFAEAVRYLAAIPRKNPDDKFLLSVFGTAKLGFLDIAKVELMTMRAGRQPDAHAARSIDDFLKWPGRILLLNDPSCASQQRGAFSLFLSAFLLRALSMPDVPAGTLRAVAIIDEALTFSLPPDVDRRIYTLCRSKGICIIAGAQRLPDRQRNERGEWQIAEYMFAMKVSDQATQASLSHRAGTMIFTQTNKSKSTHLTGASHTESEHDARFDAIPAEHFGRLAPRQFVLFHDAGLVTGKTIDVPYPTMDEYELPVFDAREDVRAVSMQLLGAQQNAT